jgi:predicted  nucleic acid-binding Zn-ribbon protein
LFIIKEEEMATLKDRLGEDGYKELEAIIFERIRTYSVTRNEFREVLIRLDVLERDVAELKADVRDMRKEFKMDIMELRKEMNDLRREMNERFDAMYERMTSLVKWTVGTLALFGTIITILYAIGLFIK